MDKNDKLKTQKHALSEAEGSKIRTDDEEKLDGEKIDELKKTVEELEDKYKRALADYQNLEKRVAEEKKELIRRANKDLLLRLLPVLDTLIQAAKHSKDEGVALSVQQFLDTLKIEGVEKIEVKDKKFDPHLMECIETIKVDSNKEEGKVLREHRTGYTLFKDILLRPAQVGVGKVRVEKEEEEKAKEQLEKGDYM